MPEATFQHLTTNLPGVEPTIGDALYGELIINTSEGRIWVGDENRIPIELGGAVKNSPIGDPNSCNYTEVLINSSEDLPIRTFDPGDVPFGYYRKALYLIDMQSIDVNVTFDHNINWGEDPNYYHSVEPTNPSASNPIDAFKVIGRKFVIELSSFGQASELIGRLLWMN